MRKLRFRPALLAGIAVVTAAAGALLYLSSGRILSQCLAAADNFDISCRRISALKFSEISLSDMRITDKRHGVGISSETATIRPAGGLPGFIKGDVFIDLREGHFIKKEAVPNSKLQYDNLDGLVSIPFSSRWTYKEISGRIRKFPGGISIESLTASGDEIRLSFTGDIYNDNRISADIKIYFAERLTEKIPEELSAAALNSEPGGWKSLSVKLEGDYKSPSIRVESRLFHLNIKSVAK